MPVPTAARNSLISSRRWRRNEMSFNLSLSLPCWEQGEWVGVGRWISVEVEYTKGDRVRESTDGKEVREAAGLVCEPFHHSLCCVTAWAERCQTLGGKHPVECWVLAATLRSFELTQNGQFLNNANPICTGEIAQTRRRCTNQLSGLNDDVGAHAARWMEQKLELHY